MNIKRFDCINNHKSKFTDFCDSYLYLDGISNKLGYRKFQIYQEKNDIIEIKKAKQQSHPWKLIAKTIVKILSYTIFPLPIIALIVKIYNRKAHTYQILKKENKIEPIKNDILVFKPIIRNKNSAKIASLLAKEEENIVLPNHIPKDLDIRGETWLDNAHLHLYIKYLGWKHPNLFAGLVPPYTFENLEEAILLDGHLDGNNCHHAELGLDCKDKTILAIPLHVTENHWTLVLVDRQKRTLEYYDSMKNYGNYDQIIKVLKNVTKVLTEKDPDEVPYQLDYKIKKRLQQDGFQCGVWILYFLENRLQDPNVNFNELDTEKAQEMIAYYRLRVMVKSLEVDLIGKEK